MFSYNRVQLIGYQTQPVDVRKTPGGTSVTDLNLVVPYHFQTEKGEHLEGKGFHTVTVWGSMADIAGQYLRAGGQVFLSGRLQTDSWEDEQSKEKRSKTKIVAMDMILLDPKDGQAPALSAGSRVASSLNRADIIGNVTRDPEMRTTTSGQQVLTLGVATNERWKDKASGEDKERAEFHSVVIWGDLAKEVQQSIRKGSKVFVSGRVQTRSWETQSGAKRYTTEIIAENISLLGTKHALVGDNVSSTGRSERMSSQSQDQETVSAIPDVEYTSEIKVEDLPF